MVIAPWLVSDPEGLAAVFQPSMVASERGRLLVGGGVEPGNCCR